MKTRRITQVAAVAVASLGLAVATVPAASAVAPARPSSVRHHLVASHFATYMTFGDRKLVDVGPSGSSVGDLTFSSGTISRTRSGASVGDFQARIQVVVPDTGSGRERRDTVVTVTLPEGKLMARAITDELTGQPPAGRVDHVIIGGTGDFAGARGVARMTFISTGFYRLDWHLTPTSVSPTIERINFTRTTAASYAQDLSQSPSSYSVLGLSGTITGRGRLGFTCGSTSSSYAGAGAAIAETWVCEYRLRGGTVLVGEVIPKSAGTAPATEATDVILGGTGLFTGVAGTARIERVTDTEYTVALRIQRPRPHRPSVTREFTQWRTRSTVGATVFEDANDIVVQSVQSVGTQFTDSTATTDLGPSPSVYTVYDSPTACQVTGQYVFKLARGSIQAFDGNTLASGCANGPTSTLVVAGGTGAYVGVRGTIAIDNTGVIQGSTTFRLTR